MKITFFAKDLHGGGAEKQLLMLANAWSKTDHAVNLLLLEKQGKFLAEIPETCACTSFSGELPTNFIGKFWTILTQSTSKIRKFFVDNPCDTVVTFLWLPTLLAAQALKGLSKRPRLIWSVQSDLEQEFAVLNDGAIRLWLTKHVTSKEVDHFIAVSTGMSKRIHKVFRISETNCSVIPNSINMTDCEKAANHIQSEKIKKDRLRLLSIGRLHPAKGMDILMQAAGQLKKKGIDFELFLIGDGPEKEQLKNLTSRLLLANNVHFTDYLPNPYSLLKTADIFISPSRWEPFGMVMLEAMTLGIPIVATETDGAVEMIQHGENGFLVPPNNAAALADAIHSLMKQPNLRAMMSRKTQEKAKQYDNRVIAQSYAEVIKRLLNPDYSSSQL